jgi:hypothetical protein
MRTQQQPAGEQSVFTAYSGAHRGVIPKTDDGQPRCAPV